MLCLLIEHSASERHDTMTIDTMENGVVVFVCLLFFCVLRRAVFIFLGKGDGGSV